MKIHSFSRYICYCLQRYVINKWPNERLVKTRVVSGFIFLRLICPAILNPRQFNLLSGKNSRNQIRYVNFQHNFVLEPPSPAASRSLVMIAKCLQNLANLVSIDLCNACVAVVCLGWAKTQLWPSQSRKESIVNCLFMEGQSFIFKNGEPNSLANLKRAKVGAKTNNKRK